MSFFGSEIHPLLVRQHPLTLEIQTTKFIQYYRQRWLQLRIDMSATLKQLSEIKFLHFSSLFSFHENSVKLGG
jgi:hypothetical protein